MSGTLGPSCSVAQADRLHLDSRGQAEWPLLASLGRRPLGCALGRFGVLALALALTVGLGAPPATAADLLYSTFIGGEHYENVVALARDSEGNVYVAGLTSSPDFPVTPGAFNTDSDWDPRMLAMYFVSRLSPDLSELQASTFLGRFVFQSYADVESGFGALAVSGAGDVVVGGSTWFYSGFPTTPGAFDQTPNGEEDGFIARLSSDLRQLVASTLLGGMQSEYLYALVLEPDGSVAVTGWTNSTDFPTSPGAFDRTYNGEEEYDVDIFVARLAGNLGDLLAGTYLGGESREAGFCLARQENGDLCVGGFSDSTSYPTTAGAFDPVHQPGDGLDGVLTRVTSELDALLASTFLGGSRDDEVSSLAIDGQGNVVAGGNTHSSDFPTTAGSYDRSFNSQNHWTSDVFLAKLNPDLADLVSSTYLGGWKNDLLHGLFLDSSGGLVATAETESVDFPVTPGAYETRFSGLFPYADVALCKLSPDLDRLLYSTFIGPGIPQAMDGDEADRAFVVGWAGSEFPVTSGAFDTTYDYSDGFVFTFAFWEGAPGLVTGPGPGPGNPPLVRAGAGQWMAYAPRRFGVNVAGGDMDGDGSLEVVTGPGPGDEYGPHVRAFDGMGLPIPGVSFLAYGTHHFGVNVSCGDIDGDFIEEIVTGAGPGAVFGPHVRGWNVDGGAAAPIAGVSFFAYGTHRFGVNVASADLDGDGREEILTGAGPGAVFGPHVRGWRYDGVETRPVPGCSFFAYAVPHHGVNVAGADLDGDGIDEILTGPGPGIGYWPHIRAWSLAAGSVHPVPGVDFFAYSGATRGAIVGAGDVDGDGIDEILTLPGPDPAWPAQVRGWNVDGGPPALIGWLDFDAYADYGLTYGGKVAWISATRERSIAVGKRASRSPGLPAP